MTSKFNREIIVSGEVTKTEVNSSANGNENGVILMKSGDDLVRFQKWSYDSNPNAARDYVNQVVVGGKYRMHAELEESIKDGIIYRNGSPRPWDQAKEITDDDEIKAVLALSGDVLSVNMSYPNVEDVPAFEYDKMDGVVPKFDAKVLYINTYAGKDNNGNVKNPLTREEVLMERIKAYKAYCEKENIQYDDEELGNWYNTLESVGGMSSFLDIYEKMKNKSGGWYKFQEINVTALGDIAEEMSKEVEKGDNITIGAFIENRMDYTPAKRDFFGNIIEEDNKNDNAGESVNRLRVGKYEVNEKCLAEESKTSGGW